MRRPVVGETLYSLNVGDAARRAPQVLTPVTVTKVGRKYFTVGNGWKEIRFRLSDWRQVPEYLTTAALYESEQEYRDKVEASEIRKEISEAFRHGRTAKELPLATLREIKRLIKEASDD